MLQQACARVESPISRRVCAGGAAARITPRIAASRAVSKHLTYSERQFTSSTGASNNPEARPPFPPYTFETATEKVRKAQDAWNTRNPDVVALAYTSDSNWRNRDEIFQGREAIRAFLRKKWAKEHDYCLMKELWGFYGNRISARFEYEWHDGQGQWWRSHGNEQWEYDAKGLMKRRDASINDVRIKESERRYIRNPSTGLVEYPLGHPSQT